MPEIGWRRKGDSNPRSPPKRERPTSPAPSPLAGKTGSFEWDRRYGAARPAQRHTRRGGNERSIAQRSADAPTGSSPAFAGGRLLRTRDRASIFAAGQRDRFPPGWADDRRVRGRRAGAPSVWSPSRGSPPAIVATPAPGSGASRPADRRDRTARRRLDGWVDGGACVAWVALRFWSQELFPAPESEAFDRGLPHKPAPEPSNRHVFKAVRAALSTRGDTSMLIDRHAARSNIHFGNSSQCPNALPSRLQCRMPPARFSITSRT
jgi:hypothetical protein